MSGGVSYVACAIMQATVFNAVCCEGVGAQGVDRVMQLKEHKVLAERKGNGSGVECNGRKGVIVTGARMVCNCVAMCNLHCSLCSVH